MALIGCSSKAPFYRTSFVYNNEKLPAKIIFINDYFEQYNKIFFLNRDYIMSYSQIVEYDLEQKQIVKEIFSSERNEQVILEYDHDSNNIVWAVLTYARDIFADIYAYNIAAKKIIKVKQNILCGKENTGFVPLSLNIDNGKIVWLEHSMEDEKTHIKQFDIRHNLETTIQTIDFLKIKEGLRFPTFFLELKNEKLFYDRKYNEGNIKIVLWDIDKNSKINEWDAKEDIILHFTGSYSEQKNFLALYAKSKKDDQIYIFDLNNLKQYPIVGFRGNSRIYDDKLRTEANNVVYSVQLNVSGKVADHYYGEIYNLNNMRMKQYKRAIDILKNDTYLCVLSFDDIRGPNKVHLELYKN